MAVKQRPYEDGECEHCVIRRWRSQCRPVKIKVWRAVKIKVPLLTALAPPPLITNLHVIPNL